MVAIKSSLIALSYLAAFVTSAPSSLNVRDTTINEPAVSSDGGTPVPIPDSVNNGNQYDSQSSSYGSGSSGSGSYDSGSSNSGSYGGSSGSYSGSGSNSGGYGSDNSGGYGSNNSGSYGGSGSSGSYGGSGGSGNYDNNYSSSTSSASMYEASSTYMYDASSTSMYEASSTSMYEPPMTTSSMMMEEATSTSMYEASSTSSAYDSYSSPSYGSGSSNWGNSGYNDCVQQCVASYGAPPSMYTPPASSGGSGSGSGKVWTVIVAPQQGVLRFVPFAVNASVGDTVRFMWGANVHTVTKSSELEVCNKTSDAPFSSGVQNKTFTFDQVVNDTNPTFFYCGVPTHCQKGMFGIINPPNAAGSASSVSMMMPSAIANNSDLSAQYSYTQMQTGGSEAASQWGMYMDVSKISASPDAQEQIYQNIMYTQLTMAQNPSMLTDGVLTPVGGTGLSVPDDITKITSSSSPSSSSGSASGGSVVSNGATNAQGVANPEATTKKSAALPRSVASSSGAIAISVVIAAFFAL